MLSNPPDGEAIIRIPADTKLEILGKRKITTGRMKQTWYKVSYKGKTGWISEYVTTGEIITGGDKKSTANKSLPEKTKAISKKASIKNNYVIPKGTYGWLFVRKLDAARQAFLRGDDAKTARIMNENVRNGYVVYFSKRTEANLVTQAGEYVQLQLAGSSDKLWFTKETVSRRR